MKQVIKNILPKISVSDEENNKIKKIISEINKKLKANLSKYNANFFVGGSVGKGTNLPGTHDIDIFIRFKENGDLSDNLEKVLKVFDNVVRLKGSRDYYKIEYEGYEIEFIPVLYCKTVSSAKNITDHSPFHVNWSKRKSKLNDDVKLAKLFFNSNGLYGAESWIGGLSGHAIEILTKHYGGFEKLLKNISEWGEEVIIDTENLYKSQLDIKYELNKSKLNKLILIDPIDKERNAAAALSEDKYNLVKKISAEFLKKPTKKYFEIKTVDVDILKKRSGKNKLFYYELEPEGDKQDVAGSKMLTRIKKIVKVVKENEFEILDHGLYWNKKDKGLIWLIVPDKDLEKKKILTGPPTYGNTHDIKSFKSKHRKVWREGYNYYTEVKRKYTKITTLMKKIDELI